jgi:hypothetical protein
MLILGGGMAMQKQYKLYRIDKDTANDVVPLLNKYTYEKINEYLVAIEYGYSGNGYKELLEEMSEIPVTQFIITASVFYKLLLHFVKSGVNLYEVKLNALFEEDNDCLYKYISAINQKKDDEGVMGELLDMLKWYNYDEGIDISHMVFGIEQGGRRFRFYFYNNGVLAVDSEKIIVPLFHLLKDIL